LIKSLLGLDYRCPPSSLTEHQESRRNTFEHLWRTLSNGSIAVLEDHLEVGSRPSTVARLLHKASVWELLSLGLGLSFSMLLAEGHVGPVARKLREALNRRPRRPALGELAANSDESAFQVVGLLRAAAQLRPVELGLDPGPSELSSILLQGRDAERFLSSLVDRHRVAKSDAPWIELVEQRVRKLAPTKAISLPIRPRAYRLDAYGQILRDLGMIT
jgi:hypothetical protein